METNPHRCTWLDLQAHDHLVDDQFIAADRYEEYMHFLHEDSGEGEPQPENLRPTA
jgi:hypothetical protein